MKVRQVVIRSIWHYRKRNSLLALGIAISTAVLTGAFIVGDSVKYSLNKIVDQRLGETSHILLSGDRYFSSGLADRIADDLNVETSPALQTQGLASSNGGQLKVNDVQVLGVDSSFDSFAKTNGFYSSLEEDSVIISANLAIRLNIKRGDDILIRMTRSSLIPLNAPFVSDADNIVTLRAGVAHVAGAHELGFFNIRNSQTAAFNVFINGAWLRREMEIGDKSNLMLINAGSRNVIELEASLREVWLLEDAGLQLRELPEGEGLEIISDRVFIEEGIANAIMENVKAKPILTYFVNSISTKNRETPYSFVTSAEEEVLGANEIKINSWLANDLDVFVGDSLVLAYFSVGPLRELEEHSRTFVVKEVIEMGVLDQYLMPEIPGLSTAGNCRDWETGVPVDLESIRDKDEDYWTRYKGTPKAEVSIDVAREMWGNRFGVYTALRSLRSSSGPDGRTEGSLRSSTESTESFERDIMRGIEPGMLGFEIRSVREDASYAANNGVSFSQLFGGLSFFLIIGAVLLSALLFLLNLEERKDQLKTLSSLGIPVKIIKRMLIYEGILISIPGVLLGLLLAVLYNRLVFAALNSIWTDIVRTQMLEVQVLPLTLLYGAAVSLLIALFSLYWPVGRYLKTVFKSKVLSQKTHRPKLFLVQGLGAFVLALLLIFWQLMEGELQNASMYFLAGGLLLYSGIVISIYWLQKGGVWNVKFSFWSLSLKNAIGNMTRSIAVIVLFSIATFLVISTGSNKKDLFVNAGDLGSGTGGFLYYAESSSPVLHRLNDTDVRYVFGFPEGVNFVQLRMAAGDDASCLNLNKISAPRILGLDADELEGRFSFVTSIPELDTDRPWRTLQDEKFSDVIPAIADETVIKWGLGMKVGDTLKYSDANGEEMRLLLVGGTAPSIFQGSVLISEERFLRHFPSSSGSNVFLIDGNVADTAMLEEELNMAMRDFGWSMTFAAERLVEFNSITNTYLSIFLALGALGLLIGTIGLSIVLFRSVLERKAELALLKAVGYSWAKIRRMIAREYSFLLIAGILIGTVSAIVATLPSFLSDNTEVSIVAILMIVAVLLVNGLGWIWWMSSISLKRPLSQAIREE